MGQILLALRRLTAIRTGAGSLIGKMPGERFEIGGMAFWHSVSGKCNTGAGRYSGCKSLKISITTFYSLDVRTNCPIGGFEEKNGLANLHCHCH
jgi:hypothetical protein